ncbi:MAG: hypothetical protein AB2708_22425 [Candidatus Thiodiazotropha taylori]
MSWFPYMFVSIDATELHFATGGTVGKGTLRDEGRGIGSEIRV